MAGIPSLEVLQQQQCEVEASLRITVSEDQIEHIAKAIEEIELFLRDIHDASAEMRIGVERIVQALLSKLHDGETSFDKQGGSGIIPMHQNKVLDRSKRVLTLDADREKDDKWILKQINENLPKLLSALNLLRTTVRLKIEDACDISTARQWGTTASTFFNSLKQLSNTTGGLFSAWMAVTSGSLPVALEHGGVAKQVVRKLADLSVLNDLKTPFADRLAALESIEHCAASEIESNIEQIGTGVSTQLKDARSQILKACCHVTKRLVRTSESWEIIAHDVTAALIRKLNVSNKVLLVSISDALTDSMRLQVKPSVIQLLITQSKAPQATVQSKCVEFLLLFVVLQCPEPNSLIVKAAIGGSTSRHAQSRKFGKMLLAECADQWPQFRGEIGDITPQVVTELQGFREIHSACSGSIIRKRKDTPSSSPSGGESPKVMQQLPSAARPRSIWEAALHPMSPSTPPPRTSPLSTLKQRMSSSQSARKSLKTSPVRVLDPSQFANTQVVNPSNSFPMCYQFEVL